MNKFALGKFGIGAKSALATGVDYYTMETIYNKKKFRFNVYSHKVDSIVPGMNMKTGEANPFYVYATGGNRDEASPRVWYYEHTEEPNGVKIIIETKKHHKQQYVDAVKSQLLYFENINFSIKSSTGVVEKVQTQVPILYQDKYIVLSDNQQYSRPHILINGVAYGAIDFSELELEPRFGNIGIKVEAEEVSVNPSRESLIWDDKTRAAVLERFNDVVKIATDMVSKELDYPDFLRWLSACANIANAYSNSTSIVGRLSTIIDTQKLSPAFTGNPAIRFGWHLFDGTSARVFKLSTSLKVNKKVKEITREGISSKDLADDLPIMISYGNASMRKDKYLLKVVYLQGFIVFPIHTRVINEQGEVVHLPEDSIRITEVMNEAKMTVKKLVMIEDALLASSNLTLYDSIQVPDSFMGNDTDEVEEDGGEVSVAPELGGAAIRRKLQGKTVLMTPRLGISFDGSGVHNGSNEIRLFEWQKIEVKASDISLWDDPEVFYGSDVDAPLIHFAALLTRRAEHILSGRYDYKDISIQEEAKSLIVPSYDGAGCTNFIGHPHVKLIKVAKDNMKYYTDFHHIHRFFQDMVGKTITMSNALIQWNTARLIHNKIKEVAFLRHFDTFNPIMAVKYRELLKYAKEYYRDMETLVTNDRFYGATNSAYQSLVQHCDKVMQFQLFVKEFHDAEAIAKLATDLFNPVDGIEITDGCAIDMKMYLQLQEVLDYGAPLSLLLNEMDIFTGSHNNNNTLVNEELEREVRNFMNYKQVAP